jgi:rhamnosyltransferase
MTEVSVVIRVKDEADSMARLLGILEQQTVRPQTVVVDSGSTDGTLEVIRRHEVELIEIPAASFTYGGALNTGTERATAEVVVALSAHSFPLDEGWLARILDAMSDERAACASSQLVGPDGEPLAGRAIQDAALARTHPKWGYSSHAGAFRRSLWAQRGFRTDMLASEDKEWAWYWLQRGYVAVLGPDLHVEHSHASDPVRSQYRRARNDWIGLGLYQEVSPPSVADLARTWWGRTRGWDNPWRARLSPARTARLLGDHAGQRAASRRS